MAITIKPDELSDPASAVAFGVMMPLLVVAALPALRRRFTRPEQRRWLALLG
ncbi:MAG: hypothetical protein H6710_07755 [Myxococcales bacterium]|nr:hypothetical protein [Myxococcales bacterium]